MFIHSSIILLANVAVHKCMGELSTPPPPPDNLPGHSPLPKYGLLKFTIAV